MATSESGSGPSPLALVRVKPLEMDEWGWNGRSIPQVVASARALLFTTMRERCR